MSVCTEVYAKLKETKLSDKEQEMIRRFADEIAKNKRKIEQDIIKEFLQKQSLDLNKFY